MNVRNLTNDVIEAIYDNDIEAVKNILLKELLPDEQLIINHISILYSATNERTDILKFLLNNRKDILRETVIDALIQSCIQNSQKSIRTLIDNRKDINLSNIISDVLLLVEVGEQEKAAKVMKTLIDNGININAVSDEGKTALEYLVDSKNNELISLLLNNHAYPKYRSKALIGYNLRDLDNAKKDLDYMLNSDWYKNLVEKEKGIKEKIKDIVNSKNEDNLKSILIEIAPNKNIESNIDRYGVLGVATNERRKLINELRETRDILGTVKRFEERIDINTKNKVLEVIEICKEKGINTIKKASQLG